MYIFLQILTELLQNEDNILLELAQSMTSEQREEHIRNLKLKKDGLSKGRCLNFDYFSKQATIQPQRQR